MASFKIGIDKETEVPTAVAASRAGDSIETAFQKKLRGPAINNTNTIVKVDTDSQQISPSTIDVIRDYDWTVSPKNEIVEHPYIILHEYRINKSPMLSELAYRIKVGIEGSGAARTGAANLNSVLGNLIGDLPERTSNSLTDMVYRAEENLFGGVDLGGSSGDNLKPFEGLYYLKKTDFNYKLPYFTSSMVNKQNSWDRSYAGDASGIFSQIITSGFDFVAKHSAGVPGLGTYAEPGLYIERGKYFQPRPGDNPLQFSFPLLNTLNEESIQKNFNLIWLLCFQNSMIRRNKASVLPPCIYRALVPGVRFMLFCVVENLSIEYKGTRRRINVTHPASGEAVSAIIPEAYNITMAINSLTTDNGNFMLSSLRDDL